MNNKNDKEKRYQELYQLLLDIEEDNLLLKLLELCINDYISSAEYKRHMLLDLRDIELKFEDLDLEGTYFEGLVCIELVLNSTLSSFKDWKSVIKSMKFIGNSSVLEKVKDCVGVILINRSFGLHQICSYEVIGD